MTRTITTAAVDAAARAIHAEGWTCEAHEPMGLDACEQCATSTPVVARAALSAALPFLGAAPSATRDEVARLIDPSGWRYFDTGMFPPDHPASTGIVHNSRETADALLARFTITPRTDR